MNNIRHVNNWRRNTKIKLVQAFGNKCSICGYDKCAAALQFHHVIPSTKKFAISVAMSVKTKSWGDIVVECKKCVMLCVRCHAELHAGVSKIPKNYFTFDETRITLITKREAKFDACSCGTRKNVMAKYCSPTCSQKAREICDWSKMNYLLASQKSHSDIARQIGCSERTIRNRRKILLSC